MARVAAALAAGRPTKCKPSTASTAIAFAEFVTPWLPGYGGSVPVRVGNAASVQFQLDIYGELVDAMALARNAGLDRAPKRGVSRRDQQSWRRTGPSRITASGKCAERMRHFTALQGDGVGRARPRDSQRREAWAARPCGALAQAARAHPRRRLSQQLRPRPQHVRPVLRCDRSRCEPAAHPAGRIPPARGPPRARHDRRRRARPRGRRIRHALSQQAPGRWSAAGRRPVSPLLVLAGRRAGAVRADG